MRSKRFARLSVKSSSQSFAFAKQHSTKRPSQIKSLSLSTFFTVNTHCKNVILSICLNNNNRKLLSKTQTVARAVTQPSHLLETGQETQGGERWCGGGRTHAKSGCARFTGILEVICTALLPGAGGQVSTIQQADGVLQLPGRLSL